MERRRQRQMCIRDSSHPDFTVTKKLVQEGIEKSKQEDKQASAGLFAPAPAHAAEKKPKASSICSVPK